MRGHEQGLALAFIATNILGASWHACSVFVHIIDVAKVILPSYSQVVVTPSPIFLPMEMLLCAISSSRNDLQVLFAIAAATH